MRSQWLKKAIKLLALLFIATILCGIVYEQIGRKRDQKRIPQIGRSVDIGGRTLNISCSGTGSPAVIFESGGAGPGLTWQPIQIEVSKFSTACWYDRAGEGWSDAGPYPRTSAAIASDLHALLRFAGVPSPYVLAGGSIGGLNSRVYAHLYPSYVAGIVMIDSAHEDEPVRAPKFYLARTAPRFLWRPLCIGLQAAAQTGIIRLLQSAPGEKKESQMTRDEVIAALRAQPKSIAGNACAGIVLPESYDEAKSIANLGNIRLIVLTAGKSPDFGNAELNQQAEAYQQVWIHEIQPKLTKLSSRGRQIVVPGATHGTIPQDVIVNSIYQVVSEAGRESALPR